MLAQQIVQLSAASRTLRSRMRHHFPDAKPANHATKRLNECFAFGNFQIGFPVIFV
jgi:hypothetical protein